MVVRYKFIYFPARGRGELIRYMFAKIQVPYEEQLVEFKDWPDEKMKMPFGALPVLEVDGKLLAQSTTIARYLAEKYGLAGNDEWTKAYADMLVQSVEDIYENYRKYFLVMMKNDETETAEALKTLMEETFKPLFHRYENFLGDKTYFAGDQLTWADLAVAELADRVERCLEKNFIENYPNLKRHMLQIHQLPNIKKYTDSRPSYTI